VKLFSVSLILSIVAPPAAACSVLSSEATRRTSDVVVRGIGTFDLNARKGVIRARQVEKGPRRAEYQVRWQVESDEGEECGEWQPLRESERGRYFLVRNDDGTFSIILHDQRPGIDR
jgi:hypothetical protein